MTQRKAIITFEGTDKKQEQAIHELQKFVAEANGEPELAATLQSERVDESAELDVDSAFGRASQ